MSTTPIASYTFLAWARHGLGVHLQNAPADELRGTIPVDVTITGTKLAGGTVSATVSRPVALYGPGDIIGIDRRAIVRTEPRHMITNFEANYLAFVEFYDEDFPWRYTPAAPSPDRKRLKPWIALIVLEEDEFEDGGDIRGRPLSFIRLKSGTAMFPPVDQLWAWAHVHVNGAMDPASINDVTAVAQRLGQVVDADRDSACSRLMCPRTLKPNTAYHAFVIPAFEAGRLAGLGLDPAAATSATQVAWEAPGDEADHVPVYHRWYFRTGAAGDFEYLVRLLQPKPANPEVGTRDIDVQLPAPTLPGILDVDLNGVLRLGGALRVPYATMETDARAEFDRYDTWADPFPHEFQQRLAQFLNLPATYADSGADHDPVIAPPIYGRWHAAITRLLDGTVDPVIDRERWLNELNLDPRYRVAAGFGTHVIQKHQDEYMEAAWQQVGHVLAGNQKIRYAMMALAASRTWNAKQLEPVRATTREHYLLMTAPVQRRVIADGLTVHHRVLESTLPGAALSKVMRQAVRPRARIARRIGFDATHNADTLLGRINAGEVSAAPPKEISPVLPAAERIAEELRPPGVHRSIMDALREWPWLRWVPLVLAILLFLVLLFAGGFGLLIGLVLIAAALWLARSLAARIAQDRAAESLLGAALTPDAVDRLPKSPDFSVDMTGTGAAPTIGTSDSEDAVRFKDALRNMAQLEVAERAIPIIQRQPLSLAMIAERTAEALRPEKTIPAWTLLHVAIPARIRAQQVDEFDEIMVYPEIDVPMYEPLKEASAEMFLPNIHLIEMNSITLLETNQKFIEAYMVGLNHEFARELLWREYPTDQRGSCFRQFWDVSGFLADPALDREAVREQLRDIPELHRWRRNENLGDHDHRELPGDDEEELVLVIRGELLKKYPTAVIYAHRAAWERNADGSIDRTKPRKLHPLTAAQEAKPPRDIVKTPLYEAKVDPDIYFFGFDFTAPTAKGGPRASAEDDPGWFFIIKERPGEPRFGLDVAKAAPQTSLQLWNDLAWSDVMVPYAAGNVVRVGARSVSLTGTAPAGGQAQFNEDRRFRWNANSHAAEIAYILYQVPVLMAVHAAEMLPKEA